MHIQTAQSCLPVLFKWNMHLDACLNEHLHTNYGEQNKLEMWIELKSYRGLPNLEAHPWYPHKKTASVGCPTGSQTPSLLNWGLLWSWLSRRSLTSPATISLEMPRTKPETNYLQLGGSTLIPWPCINHPLWIQIKKIHSPECSRRDPEQVLLWYGQSTLLELWSLYNKEQNFSLPTLVRTLVKPLLQFCWKPLEGREEEDIV